MPDIRIVDAKEWEPGPSVLNQIQKEAWDITDADIIPGYFMLSMARRGASLLLAVTNNECIGFSFTLYLPVLDGEKRYLDLDPGLYKMVIIKSGISPQYQGQGVGKEFRIRQRQLAIASSINLITW